MIQNLLATLGGDLSALSVPGNALGYATNVREMLPLLGSYEHQAYDYGSAVRELNERAKLGFTDVEIGASSMMLNALAQSPRFGNDMHLESWLGEQSAVHSGHCVLMVPDMLRRAGLLNESRQSHEIIALRIALCRCLLVHDLGEVLGEFSSLSQRTQNTSLSELPEVEREVFATALHLAFFAMQEGHPHIFYAHIADLRGRAKVGNFAGSGSAGSLQDLKELLRQFKQEVLSNCFLTEENEASMNGMLTAFDVVELKTGEESCTQDLFIGYAAKVIEHIQGTRHLVRFCTKDPEFRSVRVYGTPTFPSINESRLDEIRDERGRRTVPASLSPSVRFVKGLTYLESGLGELFEYAKSPDEIALAKAIRNACFETTIEWLNACNTVYDRGAKTMPADVLGEFRKVWDRRISEAERLEHLERAKSLLEEDRGELTERHRELRAGLSTEEIATTLLPVETRARLMSLYMQAIEKDYIPQAGPPLGLLDKIPSEIGALEHVPWNKRAGAAFQKL